MAGKTLGDLTILTTEMFSTGCFGFFRADNGNAVDGLNKIEMLRHPPVLLLSPKGEGDYQFVIDQKIPEKANAIIISDEKYNEYNGVYAGEYCVLKK